MKQLETRSVTLGTERPIIIYYIGQIHLFIRLVFVPVAFVLMRTLGHVNSIIIIILQAWPLSAELLYAGPSTPTVVELGVWVPCHEVGCIVENKYKYTPLWSKPSSDSASLVSIVISLLAKKCQDMSEIYQFFERIHIRITGDAPQRVAKPTIKRAKIVERMVINLAWPGTETWGVA